VRPGGDQQGGGEGGQGEGGEGEEGETDFVEVNIICELTDVITLDMLLPLTAALSKR